MSVADQIAALERMSASELRDRWRALTDAPATVNEDAMGKGWFAKLKLTNKADLDGLMDEAAYKKYVDELH